MKKIVLILFIGLLFSCSKNNKKIAEKAHIERGNYITNNPDEAIDALKFIILKDNRYYLDEESIKKSKIAPQIIEQLRKDIVDVNRAISKNKDFFEKNKDGVTYFETELTDFQKLNLDSIKNNYLSK